MKYITLLLLLFTSFVKAQDFIGTYKSDSTSYNNEVSPELDFKEQAEFILYLNKGNITIQDTRIPDKKLVYKCLKPLVQLIELYVYNDCFKAHLKSKTTTTITIYKKGSRLNLMVSDDKSSQVFYNLKSKTL